MASNYVEIRVKASDEAKPDIEALKFDLESLGSKVETARVEVDDKDASAKLLALNARLAELNRKVENPRLSTAGAAKVEAQIAAVDAALDHLNDKHADPKVTLEGAAKVLAEVEALDHEMDHLNDKGGRLGSMFSNLSGGLDGALSKSVPLVGSVQTLGLLAPAIGALAVEVVGVASGFAAAGAGAGAFALLARPAISQVTAAYGALNAAQAKLHAAQAKEAEDPTKANAKAVQAARLNLELANEAIGKMPQSEQAAIRGIQGLAAEFGKMSKAFEPKAFEVFAAGLGLVKKLLPDIVPFANTFADVLTKLLGQASKFAGSKGFSDWLKQFHSLEGPALNSIGQGIGRVGVAIGHLLTLMSGRDVAHAINIAFGTIATTINVVASGLHRFMQNWDSMSSTATRNAHQIASSFDSIRHAAASFGADVAHAFDNVRHGLADSAHYWASTFDRMRHDIATWAADVAHFIAQVVQFFAGLPGKILSALGNLGSLLVNAGRAIIEGLIHGIESAMGHLLSVVGNIAGFIASHKGPIEADLLLLVPHGKAIMQGLMNGMNSRIPDLRSQLGGISGMIGGMQGPGGGRGGGALQLEVMRGGGSAFEQFMVQAMRNYVRVRGGSVQAALGH